LSSRDSPAAGSTWCFHCAHRPELVNDPDFSIQWVAGRNRASVWMSSGSTPGACQNSYAEVGSGSMITSHLRLASDSAIRLESGPTVTPVNPP
jgi:hypothetical protein